MCTRERFRAALLALNSAALIIIGMTMIYKGWRIAHPAQPTHIEADNLRYLDPSQFKAVECMSDGVTWPPRADGRCYAADKPARPPYSTAEAAARCLQYDRHGDLTPIPNCMGNVPAAQPSDVIEDSVIADPETNIFYSVDCAELVGSIAWRKQHGLYPTPVPAAQSSSDARMCIAAQPDRNGNAYLAPCADGDDPYAIQGKWMDTDRLQQDDCTGKSLKDENCEGSGTIDESVQTAPPAQPCEMYDSLGKPYAAPCGPSPPSPDPGPMQGKWMGLTGESMKTIRVPNGWPPLATAAPVPMTAGSITIVVVRDGPGPMQGKWMAEPAIHDANCAEGNSEPSDLCCLNEVDEPTPCDIAHGTFSYTPPAVIVAPPLDNNNDRNEGRHL